MILPLPLREGVGGRGPHHEHTTVAAPAIVHAAAMPRSPAQLAVRRFLHRPVAVAGLAVIVLFVASGGRSRR